MYEIMSGVFWKVHKKSENFKRKWKKRTVRNIPIVRDEKYLLQHSFWLESCKGYSFVENLVLYSIDTKEMLRKEQPSFFMAKCSYYKKGKWPYLCPTDPYNKILSVGQCVRKIRESLIQTAAGKAGWKRSSSENWNANYSGNTDISLLGKLCFESEFSWVQGSIHDRT